VAMRDVHVPQPDGCGCVWDVWDAEAGIGWGERSSDDACDEPLIGVVRRAVESRVELSSVHAVQSTHRQLLPGVWHSQTMSMSDDLEDVNKRAVGRN
jgi:hypothetical protein